MRHGRDEKCVFCDSSTDDENLYGKLMSKDKMTAHYFCMLFSSGLSQNGKSEKHGILGFMPNDIMKEVKRAARLRCVYCKTNGATIGCVVKHCKKTFHLGCGRKNSTLHLFYDTFCSYCPIHRLQQDVPSCDEANLTCPICMNQVEGAPSSVTLRAPCCKTNWYHRDCLQSYATSAGLYFFKCPTCNNKDDFQQEMLTYGIYIPDQDASWETQPQAYQELLERHDSCDAKVCKCAEGRKHNIEGSKWELTLCDFCGSQGSHRACQFLVKRGRNEICPDCKRLDDLGKKKKQLLKGPPSKRRSAELMKLELPEVSKQGSQYPGASDSPKKKGLPCHEYEGQLYQKTPSLPQAGSTLRSETLTSMSLGKKRHSMSSVSKDAPATKKRCSAAAESSSSSKSATSEKSKHSGNNVMYSLTNVKKKTNNESMNTLNLVSPSAIPKRKYDKNKRKSLEVDGKQMTLMSWLNQGPAKGSTKACSTVTSEPTPSTSTPELSTVKPFASTSTASPSHTTPRKGSRKKPFIMEWKGKQLLIKSPRVLLRKNKRVGKLKPMNLEIDMKEWKEGSLQSWEMDVLTSIDTDVRVTRTMFSSENILQKTLKQESTEHVNNDRRHSKRLCRESIGTDQSEEAAGRLNKANHKKKHGPKSEHDWSELTAEETLTLFGEEEVRKANGTRTASEISPLKKGTTVKPSMESKRILRFPPNLVKIDSSVTELQTEAELTPSGKKEFRFKTTYSDYVKSSTTSFKTTYSDYVKSPTMRSSPRLNTGKTLDFGDECPFTASGRLFVNADKLKRRHTLSLVLNKTPKFVRSKNCSSDEGDTMSSSAMLMPTQSVVENEEHLMKDDPLTTPNKTQKVHTPRKSPMKGVSPNKVQIKEKSPQKSSLKVASPQKDLVKVQKDEQLHDFQCLTPTRLQLESSEVRALRSAHKERSLSAPCSPCLDKTQSVQVLPSENVQTNNDKFLQLLNYSASKHIKPRERSENKVSRSLCEDKDSAISPRNKENKSDNQSPLLLWKCAGTRQILNEESRVVTRARTGTPEKSRQVRLQGGSENRCPNVPSGEKKLSAKSATIIESEDMSLKQLKSVLDHEVGRYLETPLTGTKTIVNDESQIVTRAQIRSPEKSQQERSRAGSENQCPNLPSGEKKGSAKNATIIKSEDMSLKQLKSVLDHEVGIYVETPLTGTKTIVNDESQIVTRAQIRSPEKSQQERSRAGSENRCPNLPIGEKKWSAKNATIIEPEDMSVKQLKPVLDHELGRYVETPLTGTKTIVNDESQIVTRARIRSPEKSQQERSRAGSENRCPNLPSGEKKWSAKNTTIIEPEDMSVKQLKPVLDHELGRYVETPLTGTKTIVNDESQIVTRARIRSPEKSQQERSRAGSENRCPNLQSGETKWSDLNNIDPEDNLSLKRLKTFLKHEVGRYVEQKLTTNCVSPSRNGLRPRSGNQEKNKLADLKVKEGPNRRSNSKSGVNDRDLMLEYYQTTTVGSQTQTQRAISPVSVNSSSASETDVVEIQVT